MLSLTRKVLKMIQLNSLLPSHTHCLTCDVFHVCGTQLLSDPGFDKSRTRRAHVLRCERKFNFLPVASSKTAEQLDARPPVSSLNLQYFIYLAKERTGSTPNQKLMSISCVQKMDFAWHPTPQINSLGPLPICIEGSSAASSTTPLKSWRRLFKARSSNFSRRTIRLDLGVPRSGDEEAVWKPRVFYKKYTPAVWKALEVQKNNNKSTRFTMDPDLAQAKVWAVARNICKVTAETKIQRPKTLHFLLSTVTMFWHITRTIISQTSSEFLYLRSLQARPIDMISYSQNGFFKRQASAWFGVFSKKALVASCSAWGRK